MDRTLARLPLNPPSAPATHKKQKEKGKVGLALLMWMFGVPGALVLLYLIFA